MILISLMISGCTQTPTAGGQGADKSSEKNTSETAKEPIAEKLQVYYFHGTSRCVSCLKIGEYINKTMTEYYTEQIYNQVIDYREINADLPENKEVAKKFKASGSSLYINRIIGGKDNIEPDPAVWKLLNNEVNFKNHLKEKIDGYLGL